ncbi:MAG: hypothetical protein BWX70_01487 [Verrucomicrobia bacterium ADurb.Bin070]|nr:MAG: hypothetical protein BWX70_01487 [Verrucomicrobia bacterium ADurb.Bin070]
MAPAASTGVPPCQFEPVAQSPPAGFVQTSPAVAAATTVAISEAVEAPAVLLKVQTVPEAAFASVTRKAFKASAYASGTVRTV